MVFFSIRLSTSAFTGAGRILIRVLEANSPWQIPSVCFHPSLSSFLSLLRFPQTFQRLPTFSSYPFLCPLVFQPPWISSHPYSFYRSFQNPQFYLGSRGFPLVPRCYLLHCRSPSP